MVDGNDLKPKLSSFCVLSFTSRHQYATRHCLSHRPRVLYVCSPCVIFAISRYVYITIELSLPTQLSPATTPSSTNSAASSTQTVAYASDDPNYSYWSKFQNSVPVPERGTTGGSILGPQNIPLDREGPDFLAPPSTDSGSM